MLNPGYPFIAAPPDEFKRLKTDMKYAHAPLKCPGDGGLCYFKQSCEKLADKLPPIIFKLGPDSRKLEYSIPASSFVFPDE